MVSSAEFFISLQFTSTSPPSGVNLIAFENRIKINYCSLYWSCCINIGFSGGRNDLRITRLLGGWKETNENSEWTEHGSVVVDYYEVLNSNTSIPTSWPKIKGNHQGLQMFVYNNMHDFMRRVSKHVSIGSAFKKGSSIDSYFLLCRQ